MIPKVIHYCWFGGNEKSDIIKKCITSWEKFCPDWEIKEWNESNFDISKHPFCKEAYEHKKWAFVSDAARLLIVYEQGGIYLDTDVELLAPIESLCEYSAFFAFESERRINSGSGFGAEKNHTALENMIKCYANKHFIVDGKLDMSPCPKLNTDSLKETYQKLVLNGKTQIVDDTLFLSPGEYHKCMKHYGTATWGNSKGTNSQKEYKESKLKKFLRSERSFSFIEKHFNKNAVERYTFFVYDVLEYGIFYFIKKFFKRIF